MNKSIITREGWHVTNKGFRYYVEGGRIMYGIVNLDDGSEHRMYQYKVGRKSRHVIFYERVTPLARYYNLNRFVWRPSIGGEVNVVSCNHANNPRNMGV